MNIFNMFINDINNKINSHKNFGDNIFVLKVDYKIKKIRTIDKKQYYLI